MEFLEFHTLEIAARNIVPSSVTGTWLKPPSAMLSNASTALLFAVIVTGLRVIAFTSGQLASFALGEEPNDITPGEDSAQLLLGVDDKR
jgi:hypothetical protein